MDLALTCVRVGVRYHAILSSVYFAVFLAEQAKTLHALRAVIRLKICQRRDYIVDENCCSDGKCTDIVPFGRVRLNSASAAWGKSACILFGIVLLYRHG